jgi:hypothetical protein
MVLIWLLFSSVEGVAQQKGRYFEFSLHGGQPIKHRSFIAVDLSNPSFGGEVNLEYKTYGTKEWHQRCGFPRWGVALSYQYSGNPTQMGSAIGLLPNVTVDFLKKDHFRIFGRLGVGLAVITHPYQQTTNQANNVIGSYLNNQTSLRLGAAWRFHRQFELRPSATFTHYSNAASQMPNLGLNVVSCQLGLCYMPNPVEKEDYILYKAGEAPERKKRIQFSAVGTLGFREMETIGGPKYGVAHTSLDAGLFVTKSNRLKAGVEYDYLGNVAAFMQNNGGYESVDLTWQASRLTLYVADEIMIGRFAMLAQVGFYVTQNAFQPWFMSIRLSGRYYFRDPYQNNVAPFVTITMKSHRIVAEYFSIGFGSTF